MDNFDVTRFYMLVFLFFISFVLDEYEIQWRRFVLRALLMHYVGVFCQLVVFFPHCFFFFLRRQNYFEGLVRSLKDRTGD